VKDQSSALRISVINEENTRGKHLEENSQLRCENEYQATASAAISCGAAVGGSPGRQPWECADQGVKAAELRRLSAHKEN
jgi:hypothetical protein